MKNRTLLLCLAVLTALVALPCIAQNPADQAAGAASQAKDAASQAAQQPADQAAGAASKAKDAASQAAQQTGSAADDATTQAKVQQKLQRMSSELNLSEDQKSKLKPILQNEVGQLKGVRDDTSMSADAKQAKMKDIHASAQQQINTILTPEQQQKLATMKSEKGKD